MKHIKIEMLGRDRNGDFNCFVCAPKFGTCGEPMPNYTRLLTLNNGEHRVTVALYNNIEIPLETIKTITREVVGKYA